MTQPAIAVLPYDVRLSAETPLDALLWPLGRPEGRKAGTMGDLEADDHVIMFIKTALHFKPVPIRANLSVMILEPEIIHRKHMWMARLSHRKFYRILASYAPFVARTKNAMHLPFGTTWVPDWARLDVTKSRMCSLIASSKRDFEGHKLRHAAVDYVGAEGLDVDVMGRGYTPFDTKSDGLARYRYSVVIENMREANYFSEKLVDAVLCETVPIYWGCPNIADFMDTKGMILCESEADIRAALAQMSEADYAARLPHLRRAKEKAAHWGDLVGRAAETIRSTL